MAYFLFVNLQSINKHYVIIDIKKYAYKHTKQEKYDSNIQ
jgi:hypothetical protein